MTTSLRTIGANGCLEAFERWREKAGPWTAYVSPTMHASLGMMVRMNHDLALAESPSVPSFAASVPAIAPHQLLVLEAPAAEGLQTALDLAARRGLWPVLTSRLRFHPHGLFGDALAASLLLLRSPQASAVTGFCLVVDSHRMPSGPIDPDTYDNRHDLRFGDLPTGQDLQAVGIREVCLVSRTGAGELADDLHQWLAQVIRFRIAVRFHEPETSPEQRS